MIKLLERLQRVAALGFGAFMLLAATQVYAQGTLFDHANTGFELSGGHKFVPCESCHMNGQFAGTPHQCESCHSINGRFNARPKPIQHIFTSEQCQNCHNEVVWNVVPRVDHAEVFGACASCHNNNVAPGKPVDHIRANDDCESCHSDAVSWLPVVASQVDHGAIPNVEDCFSCHNDFIAPGKGSHPGHIDATNDCVGCHRSGFAAWTPVTVDHDLIPNVEDCARCHNDATPFTSKPPSHPPATDFCAACHSPDNLQWTPVQVDHDQLFNVENNCASCHEPNRPPPPHPQVGDCSTCHSNTTVWRPGLSM